MVKEKCVKCRCGYMVNVKYCDTCTDKDLKIINEHLNRTCEVCGYVKSYPCEDVIKNSLNKDV